MSGKSSVPRNLEEPFICVIQGLLQESGHDVVGPPGTHPPIGWLSIEHLDEAICWDDPVRFLLWAAKQGASVAEMRAYRQAELGLIFGGQ